MLRTLPVEVRALLLERDTAEDDAERAAELLEAVRLRTAEELMAVPVPLVRRPSMRPVAALEVREVEAAAIALLPERRAELLEAIMLLPLALRPTLLEMADAWRVLMSPLL